MYACRFARLFETHKCTSVACVILSFFDDFPFSSQRRIRLDMHSMYGDRSQGVSNCHSA